MCFLLSTTIVLFYLPIAGIHLSPFCTSWKIRKLHQIPRHSFTECLLKRKAIRSSLSWNTVTRRLSDSGRWSERHYKGSGSEPFRVMVGVLKRKFLYIFPATSDALNMWTKKAMNLGTAALDARIVGLRAESRSHWPNINQDQTNPNNITVYDRREVRLIACAPT